jgi:hypothetical protein
MANTDAESAWDDAERAYARVLVPIDASRTTADSNPPPSTTYVFATNDVRLTYFLDKFGKRRARNIRAGNAHGHTEERTAIGGRGFQVFDTVLPFVGQAGNALGTFRPTVDSSYFAICPHGMWFPVVASLRADGQDEIVYVTPSEEIVRAPTASAPVMLPRDATRAVVFVPVCMVRVDMLPGASPVITSNPHEDSEESHDDHACCLANSISPCDCAACDADTD